MKTLLISRVPAYFQLQKNPQSDFPPFQLQSYWLKALKDLGHETAVFIASQPLFLPPRWAALGAYTLEKFLPRLYAKLALVKNRLYRLFPANYLRSFRLIRRIQAGQFQAIIVSGGLTEFLPSVYQTVRRLKIKLYLLHGEDPLISATALEKSGLKYFDWVVVNDPSHEIGWQKLGARQTLALPYSGIDPTLYQDHHLKRRLDVVFVGTLLPERQAILKQLTEFSPAIYGYLPKGTRLDPALKPFYFGEAWGKAMIDVYNRAKIALNFSPLHMPIGGNVRLFEIPACGALQITNRCPAKWYLPGKEVVLFAGTKQLKKTLAYYLTHEAERRRIAHAGYHRTHAHYTYSKRFKAILAL